MPFVQVYHRPYLDIRETIEALPQLVANVYAISPDGSDLTASEIDVAVHPFGPLDQFGADVAIFVDLYDYPKRMVNLKARTGRLMDALGELLPPDVSFFVWPRPIRHHDAFEKRCT